MIADAQTELGTKLSAHTLFAYGGNGGLFGAGVAQNAGINRVLVFSLGPVFSAFGSSVSDICHVYERPLAEADITEAGLGRIRRAFEEIKAECAKDLLGEGIRPEGLVYALEFETSGDQRSSPLSIAEESLRSEQTLKSELAKLIGVGNSSTTKPPLLELLRVRAKKPMSKPRLVERARTNADPSDAKVGTRKVFWGSRSGQAQIYRWESLQPGNRVEGCAVIEGENTTYLVPDGWNLEVDGFGNALLTRS
jgi:acetophenone carboxylase